MQHRGSISRRTLLVSGAATAAAILVPKISVAGMAFGNASEVIKVGLIGCGGRGSGAIIDCFKASPGVELVAMADAFKDRIESSAILIKGQLKDNFKVTPERMFVGFDAYQKVIASGVDLVILAAPPGFRPSHLSAAIKAKKHVFMEKPVAVDAPGVRMVYEAAELADKQGLSIVAGTQRRHDKAYRDCMKLIHDGAIGEVVAAHAYWNQGGLWMVPRQAGWSDTEWQLRNWLYFAWLSGDHINEQHIHNLDVVNWAMKARPVKVVSLGGRQVRTDPAYGHVFDHFASEYTYASGAKMVSMCRQIDGTATNVSELLVGTKGSSNANTWVRGEKAWRYDGERGNPYEHEQAHLIAAIRSGKAINEAKQVADSTLTAVMGRMSAYTGKEITWEEAWNSTENLMPKELSFGPMAVAPVAVPGRTPFV